MAEDINSSASFGQNKNDNEELPIIVAQRFLNIFRQLHIFSDERREAFNKMLLELPPEVKAIFQSLPGGTPLQEYMEDQEQKSKGLEPVAHHSTAKNSNILQEALSSAQPHTSTGGGEGIINGDNFAKILASSLAQSNAEIIRELQNSRPATTVAGGADGANISFDGPMKLVADESFTHIISKALAEAIENSEKKRLEDNQMIARSFMELQENLTKLIEQGSQMKFIAADGSGESVAPLQMKGIVDDLVKAQSTFLKETTQNQKEELSSIISTAIKESQKVSTQALIESFQKINEGKAPTPITYAASSPKGQPAMESVEQALKAQGKEFSSIISMALKESQKNSAQTIIETLESLKKDATLGGGQNNLKVEEIMRMQANLFRDIARAQNQEFSALISSALKESQRQSTEAIIAALSQLQTAPVQTVAVPMPMPMPAPVAASRELPVDAVSAAYETPVPVDKKAEEKTVETPMINKYLPEDPEADTEETPAPAAETIPSVAAETVPTAAAAAEDAPKKKKKKKKKKNRDAENTVTTDESDINESKQTEQPQSPNASLEKTKEENKKELPDNKAESETVSQPLAEQAKEKTATPTTAEVVNTAKTVAEQAAQPAASKENEPQISPMLRKLMTISTAFADTENIKDNDISDDWDWGFSETNTTTSNTENYASEATGLGTSYSQAAENDDYSLQTDDDGAFDDVQEVSADGEDWEWEYEEVPADAAVEGSEGEDWEWEYEEVPADAAVEGSEGEDWEWEYEDSAASEETEAEESFDYEIAEDEYNDQSPEQFAQNSEIVLETFPQLVLLGLEDEKFRDPYIENSDNIG